VRDHVVQFYDSDGFLTQEVARWFELGFRGNEACVMVANDAHRSLLAGELGADADRIVFLDAAQQLAGFDGPDGVDPSLFERTVGRFVQHATAEGKRVRAFGEMVALLAERGRHGDALVLENCWNELIRRRHVDLLCAYPLALFDRAESRDAFRAVCGAHTHVLPAEPPRPLGQERDEHHAAAAAAAPAPATGRSEGSAQGRSVRHVTPRKVLVVDDDQGMAETIARWLRASGHAVHVATDGAAAIAEVVRQRPEIVLLDIAMPKIDGYEVARRLRALPALHAFVLVALTGLAQPDDVARAHRAGFDHHLAKPPDLARLEAILRSGL
jgi:CheY-like chemotaxis protein